MSTFGIKIDKFDGRNNFSLWQIKMRALLKQQGLWAPLSGKKHEVVESTKKEEKQEGVETSKKAEKQEGKKLEADDTEAANLEEKAHSTILLCLSDDVITEVATETTAAGLWLKLESLYMTKSLTNKLLLKQRLFGLRMHEGASLKEHLDELNTLMLELRNIDVKIDDEDAAMILLVSLPPSYENFVQSFVVGKDTVSLEDVRSALHSMELHHKANGNITSNQSSGLAATGGKKNFTKKTYGPKTQFSKGPNFVESSKEYKPNIICSFCKEKGHWRGKCPRKKWRQKHATASVAVNNNSNSDGDFTLIANESSKYSDIWILDSGASYHICPHKEWFTSYKPIDGGNIIMANDDVCKTVGIGSIRIRSHTGKIIRLTDVRHVPQMTKNLISLSVLDGKGCRFQGRGGVLTVRKGPTTVLRGIKRGTLFVLQGSTIIGSAAVAGTSKEADLTRLWHMRLGHMSERGMQILSKRGLLEGHNVKNLGFCEQCVFGKLHRSKFGKAVHRTKGTLDYVHANCWGPSRVGSMRGSRYFISVIDDYS